MEAESYSGSQDSSVPMGLGRDIAQALERKRHMLALIPMKGELPRTFITELYYESKRMNRKLILIGHRKDVGWMSAVIRSAEKETGGKERVASFTSRDLVCHLDGSGNDTGDLLNHCVRKDRIDDCIFQSGFDLDIYRQIRSSGGTLLAEMEQEIISKGMCPARLALDLASEAQTIVTDHPFVFSEGWDKIFEFMGQDPKNCILGICDPSSLIDHLRSRFSYSFDLREMDISSWDLGRISPVAEKGFEALLDVMKEIAECSDPKKPLERKWLIQEYGKRVDDAGISMRIGTLIDNIKEILDRGEFKTISGRRKVKDIYLFMKLWMEEHSSVARTLEDRREGRAIKLSILDLQLMIRPILQSFQSVVMFGDTLYPQGLYTALLGLTPESTYNRSYVSSDLMKRTTVISMANVDTSYKYRGEIQWNNIVRNLERIVSTSPGTCVAVLPSYFILEKVMGSMADHRMDVPVIAEERELQKSERRAMVEEARNGEKILVLAVQGGYVARAVEEGTLGPHTVVMVGVHIPPPSPVSDQLKVHLQKRHGTNLGHIISVFMPAMTKVMRMINSMADAKEKERNLVVLMDRRYQDRKVLDSLPRFYDIKRLSSEKDYDGERYFKIGSSNDRG
ncbi:MAG: helicase C-terminal domain-containing protein [Candidatus Thermoplasmatota archaeon]|nr:helicase C-terminal domain-containing protein [Candidatus Thermoplasmatota archaeon]